jgi:hypothetical protein
MSWRAPGSAGEAQISRPVRVGEDLHVHAGVCASPSSGAGRGPSHADPVNPQQRAVQDHERLPCCGRRPRRRRWGERDQDLEGFADVTEQRGGADAGPGGEVGVGRALAQVRRDEQGLSAHGQPAPAGPDLASALA